MTKPAPVYDPSPADGRFQLETLALRWVLVGLYGLFVGVGFIDVSRAWFGASEGFLIAWHVYYTWYTWYELTRRPLPQEFNYATPFVDTVSVTLALIAVGDPLHPIWAVYFFIMVAVAFYYYSVARTYGFWLVANYALVGMGLQLRGFVVPGPQMTVAGVILLAGLFNLAMYTGGERRLRGRISEVARRDPLTNLRNRRGLEEALSGQLDPARGQKPFAVLMIDVDRFKRYNDQFGHLAADRVLEQLGELLAASTREPDLVARYGGDEFVVILPDVTPDDAVLLAERLRLQVARSGLCTVSVGVSVSREDNASVQELLAQADGALLRAKHAGRNRIDGPTPPTPRAA